MVSKKLARRRSNNVSGRSAALIVQRKDDYGTQWHATPAANPSSETASARAPKSVQSPRDWTLDQLASDTSSLPPAGAGPRRNADRGCAPAACVPFLEEPES